MCKIVLSFPNTPQLGQKSYSRQNRAFQYKIIYIQSSIKKRVFEEGDYCVIISLQMRFSPEMSLMENHQNIWGQQEQQEEEYNSEPKAQAPQSPNRNAELLEAKERLMAFMEELHEHRKSDIRGDILQHCEQVNKNKKVIATYISDQTIARTVTSRIDKMIKNKRFKKNWSEEDVKILVWVISKYCDKQNIENVDKQLAIEDWERIAQLIPGVTGNSCMFKWLSIRKTNLSNCNWSYEESELLRELIQHQQTNGFIVNNFTNLNWKNVAEQLYFRNASPLKVFRSSKQCRQHWNCFLNPRLKKGPWLIQEDIQLLSLIKNNNGNKKWSEIVYFFEGRTENALKNRYTLLLDKQKRISKSKQEISLIQDCLQKCFQEQLSSNSYRDQVAIEPISDLKDQVDMKECYSIIDSIEKESQNIKSEVNTISSTSPTPTTSSGMKFETKIHYLTSSEQLEFFEWIKRRSDIKRGYLKNGSLQIEQC